MFEVKWLIGNTLFISLVIILFITILSTLSDFIKNCKRNKRQAKKYKEILEQFTVEKTFEPSKTICKKFYGYGVTKENLSRPKIAKDRHKMRLEDDKIKLDEIKDYMNICKKNSGRQAK